MHFVPYVQPVAYHSAFPHRLLLKDEAGRWYTWMGDDAGLVEIEDELAQWMYRRPEMHPVSGPAMWFEPDSLPVGNEQTTH